MQEARTLELPGGAQLHVPVMLRPEAGTADLTVHLHGAHATVRDAFLRSRRRGALVTLTLPGLSAVYTRHFSPDPAAVFFALLEASRRALGLRGFDSVWVSSFSAGFGGVRELLQSSPVTQRIDALVLADTLYAGFAASRRKEGVRPLPDPANLEGFVRFAREAAEARTRAMLVTYCDLLPPEYAATRETAEALRQAVGATDRSRRAEWPEDLTLTAHARQGRFATYGFSGDDGPAHLRHLRALWIWYRLVPRA